MTPEKGASWSCGTLVQQLSYCQQVVAHLEKVLKDTEHDLLPPQSSILYFTYFFAKGKPFYSHSLR
jgi:hypothetical protein